MLRQIVCSEVVACKLFEHSDHIGGEEDEYVAKEAVHLGRS